MSFDTGYHDRMAWLVELILMPQNHRKPMKKLQREALRMYPLFYTESIRHWMSWRIGFKAAEIANKKEFPDLFGGKV